MSKRPAILWNDIDRIPVAMLKGLHVFGAAPEVSGHLHHA